MADIQSLITEALQLLGIYGPTEPVLTEDLNDCLTILNLMLDGWNAQHLMVYTIVNQVAALTPMVGSYTCGTGGSLAFARPAKIETAGLVRSDSGVRNDMQIDTSSSWASIPEKTVRGKLPLRLYCDYAYPRTTIKIWPIPSQACSLDLNMWSALAVPVLLGTEVNFPPGYPKAMLYNLTVEIAPKFGRDPGPVILGIAQQSKAEVMALNASMFAGLLDPPAPPAPAAA